MGTIGAILVVIATLLAALWVVGHPVPESTKLPQLEESLDLYRASQTRIGLSGVLSVS